MSNKPSKNNPKPTPAFASESEERAYWESHDSTAHLDWSKAQKVKLPNMDSINLHVLILKQD